jgi:hypothetical protein
MFIVFIAIGILTGLMSAAFALLAGFGVLAALGFYCICGSIGTILAVVWYLSPRLLFHPKQTVNQQG